MNLEQSKESLQSHYYDTAPAVDESSGADARGWDIDEHGGDESAVLFDC